jgi:hypothetical protein
MALAMPVSSCELETKTPELATPPYWGLIPPDRLDHFKLTMNDVLKSIVESFESQAIPITKEVHNDNRAEASGTSEHEQGVSCVRSAIRIGSFVFSSYQEKGAVIHSLVQRVRPREPIMKAHRIIQNGNDTAGEKYQFRSDIADETNIIVGPLTTEDIHKIERVATIYRKVMEDRRHQNQ